MNNLYLNKKSALFIIPTTGGGGAEKIFSILKSNIQSDLYTFLSIWGETNSIYNFSQPNSLFKRLVLSFLSPFFYTFQKNQYASIVAILPLSLLVAFMFSIFMAKGDVKIIYCRRNNYRPYSLNRLIEKLLVRFCSMVFYCSDEVKIRLPSSIHTDTLPNLIPVYTGPNKTFGEDICIVGRLVKHKMPFLAIDAFAHYQKVSPTDQKLALIGTGELFGSIKNYIANAMLSKNVSLLGYVKCPFESAQYSVLIHTSKYEGSPNTIYEALSAGMVVICRSSIEGISFLDVEILENCMVLVDDAMCVDDASQWAGAIKVANSLYKKNTKQFRIEIVKKYTSTPKEFADKFLGCIDPPL